MRLSAIVLGCLLLAAVASPVAARTADPFAAFDRVRALLEDPGAPAGDLPLECAIQLETGATRGRVILPMQLLVDLRGLLGEAESPPERLRVTLAAATIEGELATFQETVATGFGAGSREGDTAPPEAWLYRGRLELADDVHGAAAVVQVLDGTGPSEAWGGCFAQLTDQALAPPPALRVAVHDPGVEEAAEGEGAAGAAEDTVTTPTGEPASGVGTNDEPTARAEAAARQIVLLPPDERPAVGRTEIDTMVTTELIRRAVFYLDGEEVATDERPPFSATLDLGSEAAPHTVRVVAQDRGGVPLGEHEITLNRRSAPFDVAITQVRPVHSHRPRALPGEGGSFIHVEAEVSVPPDAVLDRVEVYRNEELISTLRQPPWTARLPQAGESSPSDYVRVLAVLRDGRSLEDVRLLAAGTPGERVEVNLVELFAVVTNPDGKPIENLGPEDFRITWNGRRQEVERFQVADDVPLTLGLLVDTSGSMWPLMVDTKQAAGRFLVQTLIEGDQAFLVGFADRAKLLHPATQDPLELLGSFRRLVAGGATALYDSIVFSLAQIQETSGRRALVLLTDGYDQGSRFGTRRAIHDARRLAVPVYVVSLAGLYNERGSVRRADLEAITEHTGGRIYYIRDAGELSGAYDEINRELRSQYVLAFGTERFLTEEELEDIEVEMVRDGLEVRWAAGSTR
jgi:Ca-activated chloride channel family protein